MRPSTVRWAEKRRFVAITLLCAGSALAVSGCTSTLSTLDTATFAPSNPPQSVPSFATIDGTLAAPAPRPTAALNAPAQSSSPQGQELAAFTPQTADSAAPAAALAFPQAPVANAPIVQTSTPIATTLPPSAPEASATADLRIAQANGDVPVVAAPTPAPQPQPVIASAANVAPTVASPNRLGLFNRFFNRGSGSPQPPAALPNTSPAPAAAATAPAPTVAAAPTTATETSIALASGPAETPAPPPPTVIAASANGATLPGVDKERLLGFGQADDPEPETRPVQVASAAGLARLAPNGLRVQHSGVDVACLKPALVRVLKKVERKFGKPVVVTSGYRSPSRNSNARGAKNSLHIYCAAADIQIEGVTKWELASYLRSMPGRGGVGTYCHTRSVHIDIGPKRDWNWRCRRG